MRRNTQCGVEFGVTSQKVSAGPCSLDQMSLQEFTAQVDSQSLLRKPCVSPRLPQPRTKRQTEPKKGVDSSPFSALIGVATLAFLFLTSTINFTSACCSLWVWMCIIWVHNIYYHISYFINHMQYYILCSKFMLYIQIYLCVFITFCSVYDLNV